MISPVQMNDDFLEDVRRAKGEPDRMHLWWLGQSGFLVQWQGQHLLLDPYLSDSLTLKYAGTDKPHVRMTERAISPEQLDFIDVVSSSHNHTDHLDGETIIPLLSVNPDLAILVSEPNREFVAQRLKVSHERLTGIHTVTSAATTAGAPVQVGAFAFNAIPSAHEAVELDSNGDSRYIGLVVRAGPWTFYHSGDTVRYPEMAELLRRWRIDLALLPINGRDPQRGVAGNLSGREAAQLACDIGAGLAVPCHYEMFEFNSATPDEFVQVAQQLSQPYRVMKCGERLSL
jgi:L-ascorbate metabolism protein UlaG (beta-lactamase superfamily)